MTNRTPSRVKSTIFKAEALEQLHTRERPLLPPESRMSNHAPGVCSFGMVIGELGMPGFENFLNIAHFPFTKAMYDVAPAKVD
jgi:hypothetical protein